MEVEIQAISEGDEEEKSGCCAEPQQAECVITPPPSPGQVDRSQAVLNYAPGLIDFTSK
jgi:hypothetical protein